MSPIMLFPQIHDRGYRGGPRTVYKFLQSLRTSPPSPPSPRTAPPLPSPLDGVSPRQVVRWLVRPIDERTSKTKEILVLIAQANHEVAQAQLLVEEFLTLVRELQGSDLERWLERVKTTEVKELRQFAHGLERDKAALWRG